MSSRSGFYFLLFCFQFFRFPDFLLSIFQASYRQRQKTEIQLSPVISAAASSSVSPESFSILHLFCKICSRPCVKTEKNLQKQHFKPFLFLEAEFVLQVALKLCNWHSHLLHGIAVADSNSAVCLRVKVVGYAERSSDLILSSLSLSDISSVVKLAVIVLGKLCVNLLCALV